jgi:hypothetical protein
VIVQVVDRAAMAGCWAARIAGLLFALLFLAFLVGEGPPPMWNLHFLGLAGIACGLIAAWKWEGVGGAITLAGCGLLWLADRGFAAGAAAPLAVMPAATGLLHVVCWARLRGAAPGRLPWAVWVALAVFLLLCGNEVLGNPPLMTPGRPAAAVVGRWRSAAGNPGVVLAVGGDGALAGTIDGKRLSDGRVSGNRSWFGKMMHWRTDYRIRGKLNGDPVHGWLVVKAPKLEGDVLVGGRLSRFEVVR